MKFKLNEKISIFNNYFMETTDYINLYYIYKIENERYLQ